MKTNIDHGSKHITLITNGKLTPSEFMEVVGETLKGRSDEWTVSTDTDQYQKMITDPNTFKIPDSKPYQGVGDSISPYFSDEYPNNSMPKTHGVENTLNPTGKNTLFS